MTVFPNKNPSDAYRLANRLRKNIRTRSCLIKGRQISITFSGGIAGYPTDANTIEEVLDKADKALYYSKNHGRSRITKYSDLGRKEVLQMTALLLALLAAGCLLYRYRDPLSIRFNKATTSIVKIDAASNNLSLTKKTNKPILDTFKEPGVPIPTKTESVSAAPSGSETSKIYLESGRVVQGVLKGEDDNVVKIEVGLKEGRGMLRIKKSQIIRIETGSKTRQIRT